MAVGPVPETRRQAQLRAHPGGAREAVARLHVQRETQPRVAQLRVISHQLLDPTHRYRGLKPVTELPCPVVARMGGAEDESPHSLGRLCHRIAPRMARADRQQAVHGTRGVPNAVCDTTIAQALSSEGSNGRTFLLHQLTPVPYRAANKRLNANAIACRNVAAPCRWPSRKIAHSRYRVSGSKGHVVLFVSRQIAVFKNLLMGSNYRITQYRSSTTQYIREMHMLQRRHLSVSLRNRSGPHSHFNFAQFIYESVQTSETVIKLCTNDRFIAKIIVVQITNNVPPTSGTPSLSEYNCKTTSEVTFSTPTLTEMYRTITALKSRYYFEYDSTAQSTSAELTKVLLQPLA